MGQAKMPEEYFNIITGRAGCKSEKCAYAIASATSRVNVFIANLAELRHGLRHVLRGHFEWSAYVGRINAVLAADPAATAVTVVVDCTPPPFKEDVAVRLRLELAYRRAVAELLVGGRKQELGELQPPLFQVLAPFALSGRFAWRRFLTHLPAVKHWPPKVWAAAIREHFAALQLLSPSQIASGGDDCYFPSGFQSLDGDRIFARLLARGRDGRFTLVDFFDERSVAGRTNLPPPMSFRRFWPGDWLALPRRELSRHVVDHGTRWLGEDAPDFLGHDERGRDVWSSSEVEDRIFGLAKSALTTALSDAPDERLALGFYDSTIDQVDSDALPICGLLPAFCSPKARAAHNVDGVFVLRVHAGPDGVPRCLSVPTIYKPGFCRRLIVATGEPMPSWLH